MMMIGYSTTVFNRFQAVSIEVYLVISPIAPFKNPCTFVVLICKLANQQLFPPRAPVSFPCLPLVPLPARDGTHHTSIQAPKTCSTASLGSVVSLFSDLSLSKSLDGISNGALHWSIPSWKTFVQAFTDIASADLAK